jgi:phosphatidylserine decarboxylase
MRLPIAREGLREIAVTGAAALALGLAGAAWYRPLIAVAGAGWLAILLFFRDPRRTPPPAGDVLLAPADGWVRHVRREPSHPMLNGPVLRVQIFLTIFDVHVNRSPCPARVTDVRYKEGQFINAIRDESTDGNESNAIVMLAESVARRPMVVRQIAGAIARRIVCNVRPGDRIEAGQRLGMIKFGSRTELLVPDSEDWQVAVRVGDHVKAGQTVLLRRSPAPQPAGQTPKGSQA